MRLAHDSVMLERAVDLWASSSARRVVDGTVGRAGHSLALLGRNDSVRLLALDRDPQAVEFVERRFSGFDGRARVLHGSYADLPLHLAAWGEGPVDGILLDLGVSSPQLDDASRGFSTRADAPLDLRFDRARGASAAEWLADVDLDELTRVLAEYGEVPRPRRVARAILDAHASAPIETTGRLRQVVEGVARRPGEPPAKALARVFQAVRIAVNDELAHLDRFLAQLDQVLAPGGRIVILSFHSLEDRRVKHAFREAARDCVCPPELPVCRCGGKRAWLRELTRRPLTADAEELARNPRARSARLRAAERIGEGAAS
ncbi:MAG: 16S rRNA (cytosine(1402)-N(4))-methyltransferase RsmH [Gemmatimonadetes bacterium]|nr:16S rRNA (cytosine(1402)-N(4))-methyltransferase RsmH [Gemmatimonadota bacterium]